MRTLSACAMYELPYVGSCLRCSGVAWTGRPSSQKCAFVRSWRVKGTPARRSVSSYLTGEALLGDRRPIVKSEGCRCGRTFYTPSLTSGNHSPNQIMTETLSTLSAKAPSAKLGDSSLSYSNLL